jgi:zinc protease
MTPKVPRRAAIKLAAAAIAAVAAERAAVAQAVPDAPVFGAVAGKLPNGLTVVCLESRRAPVAAQMLWYRVGSADEPQGLSGMAHFLEHLMFRGTPTVPAGQFSRRVARTGGNDNAFTSFDYTAYHQQVARESLSTVMAMEADRMAHLLLDPATIETERGVILEERRQVVDNSPRAKFRERLNAALFVNHPYGRPVIGWEHEIRTIPRDALAAFHAKHYAPDNAILLLSGAVSPNEAMALAAEHYGAIPGKGVAARVRPQEPPSLGDRRLSLRDARAAEPALTRAWVAPGFMTDASAAYALELAAHIIGGGPGSRLHAVLVEPGLATAASGWFSGEAVDATDFAIGAATRPGTKQETLEAALDGALKKLLDDGVTDAEVARSARQMTAGAVFARDSLMGGARVVGAALSVGMALPEIEAWPARIRAVTAAQVTEAVRAVLARPAVTGWLLPGTNS